ncbi:Transposase domain [Acidocella aminolytica 101 = DSM 11237]|nr:Transposase domain [Acidocella aminolytica 101 = DSM 11237]
MRKLGYGELALFSKTERANTHPDAPRDIFPTAPSDPRQHVPPAVPLRAHRRASCSPVGQVSPTACALQIIPAGEGKRRRSGLGDELFSFVRLEEPVPSDHPLRVIRALADEILAGLSSSFSGLYAYTGRPSIPPEMLLRATLLQALYSVRSERMLMEQMNYNLLFRWFVGLSMDAPVWHPTGFTHNRDRLLQADVARAFLQGRWRCPGSNACCRRNISLKMAH